MTDDHDIRGALRQDLDRIEGRNVLPAEVVRTVRARRMRSVVAVASTIALVAGAGVVLSQTGDAPDDQAEVVAPQPTPAKLVSFSLDASELQPGEPFTLTIANRRRLCTDSWMDLEQEVGGRWELLYRLVLPYDAMKRGAFFSADQDAPQHDIALCQRGPVRMLMPPLEPGTYRLSNDYGGKKPYIVSVTFEIAQDHGEPGSDSIVLEGELDDERWVVRAAAKQDREHGLGPLLCIGFAIGSYGEHGPDTCTPASKARSSERTLGLVGGLHDDVRYFFGYAGPAVDEIGLDLESGRLLDMSLSGVDPELDLRFFAIFVTPDTEGVAVARGRDGERLMKAELQPRPDPTSDGGLPPLVARVRSKILDATDAGSYDLLRQQLEPRSFLSDVGFGRDPIPYWEKKGDRPLEVIEALLSMTFLRENTNEGEVFRWPVYGPESSRSDVSEQDERSFLRVMSRREFERLFSSEMGYVGPRIGILADGTWWYFVLEGP